MLLFLLCVGLILIGYSLMVAVVYALCRFFRVGVERWGGEDDWTSAKRTAIFLADWGLGCFSSGPGK
jgi:hypothetical protein